MSAYKRQIYQITESNRKNRFGIENQIENFFSPNWNAVLMRHHLMPLVHVSVAVRCCVVVFKVRAVAGGASLGRDGRRVH